MQTAVIGVIGGSGLYQMDALRDAQDHRIETPFGTPSEVVITGRIDDIPVAFLARHGRGHRLLPSEVPYRANIYAMNCWAFATCCPSPRWALCVRNFVPSIWSYPTSSST